MSLQDEANGGEHTLKVRRNTAVYHTAPFFGCEGFFAPRTWFANVTFLCTDNSITTTHTHHGNNHSAWDHHEGVLIVRSRMASKCKLTMEFRVRITVDGGVDIVL